MNDIILFLNSHFVISYFLHMIVSFALAWYLAKYTRIRYPTDTKTAKEIDQKRSQEVMLYSKAFLFLFQVSLHKNNYYANVAFLFLISLLLPGVGYFFIVWITWYLRHTKYSKEVSSTSILNLDEFRNSFMKVERIFGEASMGDLMTNPYAPKSKKLKALSSLANHASAANLRIIRQTLFSTDDEIRMFGYAIINKAEQAVNTKVNKQLNILTQEGEKPAHKQDQEKIATAQKELAFLYWEMIYVELAHESLRDNFLQEVIHYLNESKKFYEKEIEDIPLRTKRLKAKQIKLENRSIGVDEKIREEDTVEYVIKQIDSLDKKYEGYLETLVRLYILSGKVYMKKRFYEDAEIQFELAQHFNNGKLSFVLPYLAEIKFLTRQYSEVSRLLNTKDSLELNATLYPIIEQWRIKNDNY